MESNDIIKALECCFIEQQCNYCPLYKEHSADCLDTVLKNAHALIIHQQAENENLKVENQSLRSAANSLKMHYEEAQAEIESLKIFRGYAEKRASDYRTMRDKYLNAKFEAYKEFAERMKHSFFDNGYESPDVDFDYFVDEILKELVGVDNAEEKE